MHNKNKKDELHYKEKVGKIKQNYSFPNLGFNIMKYIKYFILIMTFYVLFFKRKYNICENPSHIHIAMSLNNNYTYPIMVSITSILLNSNKNTFIQFHI